MNNIKSLHLQKAKRKKFGTILPVYQNRSMELISVIVKLCQTYLPEKDLFWSKLQNLYRRFYEMLYSNYCNFIADFGYCPAPTDAMKSDVHLPQLVNYLFHWKKIRYQWFWGFFSSFFKQNVKYFLAPASWMYLFPFFVIYDRKWRGFEFGLLVGQEKQLEDIILLENMSIFHNFWTF